MRRNRSSKYEKKDLWYCTTSLCPYNSKKEIILFSLPFSWESISEISCFWISRFYSQIQTIISKQRISIHAITSNFFPTKIIIEFLFAPYLIYWSFFEFKISPDTIIGSENSFFNSCDFLPKSYRKYRL